MNKLLLFVLLTLAVQLSAFELKPSLTVQSKSALNVPVDPPKTVPYVNLTRYLGVWYQQAAIPEPFQADCTNSFANYSLYDDGSLKVINTCYRKGQINQLVGRAVPDPADTEHTNAKLKVRFPNSPRDGDYWIVRLDESYSYVVVSGPSYNYLWILYRSPRISDTLYDSIVQDLKEDGFPVERLRKTIIN